MEPAPPLAHKLYISFMEELKVRLGGIRAMLDEFSKIKSDQGYFVAEACYLQMRFICELLALACLAAHEPLGLTERLKGEWNADAVFAALEKLNPSAFPRPIKIVLTGGDTQFQVQPQTAMNRSSLKKIYHSCGHALHRGVISDALEGKARHYDLEQLNQWGGAFWNLLEEHMVYVPQLGQVFLINMMGGRNGAVQFFHAQADEAGQ